MHNMLKYIIHPRNILRDISTLSDTLTALLGVGAILHIGMSGADALVGVLGLVYFTTLAGRKVTSLLWGQLFYWSLFAVSAEDDVVTLLVSSIFIIANAVTMWAWSELDELGEGIVTREYPITIAYSYLVTYAVFVLAYSWTLSELSAGDNILNANYVAIAIVIGVAICMRHWWFWVFLCTFHVIDIAEAVINYQYDDNLWTVDLLISIISLAICVYGVLSWMRGEKPSKVSHG